MEKIRRRRAIEPGKPNFPKKSSRRGVKRSFRFSLRAWFNFKTYLLLILLVAAAAVLSFALFESLNFNAEQPMDVFYETNAGVSEFSALALAKVIGCVLSILLTLYLVCLFIYKTGVLIVRIIRVPTMRLEFHDDVMVWKWGRIFKRYVEKRFVGVYDVLVMPKNKYYYKDKRENKKPAKYGTVLAKVPGGGYEWNLKIYGVKKYVDLKNYLESKKITERFERPRSNFHDDSI